ncbi:MAG: lysophospholipid acyltransferase family protein [Desulfovibrio sp.]|nr:lysophospholipid acyltransferase family protein [Desulfovibrio sp.]
MQKGKGLILLSAHTGCWQMAPFTLAQHAPVPVTVLAHRERDDVDRQAHEHAGREPPYAIIAAGSGPAATVSLAAALQRGEFVCMMGDRIFDPGEMGVLVAFLGGIVRLPVAAYRLASVCGVPLAVVFSLRTGPRRGELVIADIMHVPGSLGKKGENYFPYAQRFADVLETFVRGHPYQFFNFYNLWEP